MPFSKTIIHLHNTITLMEISISISRIQLLVWQFKMSCPVFVCFYERDCDT